MDGTRGSLSVYPTFTEALPFPFLPLFFVDGRAMRRVGAWAGGKLSETADDIPGDEARE